MLANKRSSRVEVPLTFSPKTSGRLGVRAPKRPKSQKATLSMISNNNTQAVEVYQDMFKQFAGAIQNHLELKNDLNENRVCEIIDERVRQARLPRPVEVMLPSGKTILLEGRQHAQFDELLSLVQEGASNILMVGPAGSGKTTLAKNVAKALNRDFGFISLSAGVTETHLFGRLLPQSDGSWAYATSRFVEVYENGGVFLLDEVDAADSNVMVAVNAALANGVLANPVSGKIHTRHADTIILAAANTYGRGGDHMYVGRNALDAATLDRFVLDTMHVSYDTELENDILRAMITDRQAEEVAAWVTTLRRTITENRLRRVASTRLAERAARTIKAGKTLADVKKRFFQDWSKDELSKVGGAL